MNMDINKGFVQYLFNSASEIQIICPSDENNYISYLCIYNPYLEPENIKLKILFDDGEQEIILDKKRYFILNNVFINGIYCIIPPEFDESIGNIKINTIEKEKEGNQCQTKL